MRHEELILGDWVLYDGKPAKVECLSEYGITIVLFRKGEHMSCAALTQDQEDRCRPIPLTEDILLMNGFTYIEYEPDTTPPLFKEKTSNLELKGEYIYRTGKKDDPDGIIRIVYLEKDKNWYIIESCGCYGGILMAIINFVHQLQHALYIGEMGKIFTL